MAQDDDKTWARDRDLIRSLVSTVDADGRPYSRKKIVLETGLTQYRVTKICKAEGIKFNGSNAGLEAMRAANEVNARIVRSNISRQVLEEITIVLKKMHSPHVVLGWYQGMAFEHTLQQPTSNDYKNYATVLGILIDKHLVLERYGSENGENDDALEKVQLVSELTRLVKSNPDLTVDDIVNEITKR